MEHLDVCVETRISEFHRRFSTVALTEGASMTLHCVHMTSDSHTAASEVLFLTLPTEGKPDDVQGDITYCYSSEACINNLYESSLMCNKTDTATQIHGGGAGGRVCYAESRALRKGDYGQGMRAVRCKLVPDCMRRPRPRPSTRTVP